MSLVKIKLDRFEGPLDLLLHLVEKNELDICEVSLAMVADQFIEIIENEIPLDVVSDFLVIAARLIVLKSRSILPQINVSEDVDEACEEECSDLIERLKEYRQYRVLGEKLGCLREMRSRLVSASSYDFSEHVTEQDYLSGITLDKLLGYMQKLILEKDVILQTGIVEREEISVSQRIEEISAKLKITKKFSFFELLPKKKLSNEYIVSTFLALLELVKSQQVHCVQSELFSEIIIKAD